MKDKRTKKVSIAIISSLFVVALLNFGFKRVALIKNTKNLENKLSEGLYEEQGIANDLFDFDYDKMYVFNPYEPKSSMEGALGFHCSVLRETVSEGMHNIIFIKGTTPVAYLYGYPSNEGYSIYVHSGEYTKSNLETINYSKKKGNKNSIIYYALGDIEILLD